MRSAARTGTPRAEGVPDRCTRRASGPRPHATRMIPDGSLWSLTGTVPFTERVDTAILKLFNDLVCPHGARGGGAVRPQQARQFTIEGPGGVDSSSQGEPSPVNASSR